MGYINCLANFAAVVVFVWLIYRAGVIVLSVSYRCNELRLDEEGLTALTQAFSEYLARLRTKSSPTDGKWRSQVSMLGDFFSAERAADRGVHMMLRSVLSCRSRDECELADELFTHWHDALGKRYDDNYATAALAEKAGLFFTVVGGLFAFWNIAEAASPFESFAALALAMITTAIGLLISVAVSAALDRFERRWEQVGTAAKNQLLGLALELAEFPATGKVSRESAGPTRNNPSPEQNAAAVLRSADSTTEQEGGAR